MVVPPGYIWETGGLLGGGSYTNGFQAINFQSLHFPVESLLKLCWEPSALPALLSQLPPKSFPKERPYNCTFLLCPGV